jgi:hypothetical protein
VSELLAVADLHGADQLKAHAAAFVKENAAAVVKTEGWAELVKNPALVNYVICTMASQPISAIPSRNSQQQKGGCWFSKWFSG